MPSNMMQDAVVEVPTRKPSLIPIALPLETLPFLTIATGLFTFAFTVSLFYGFGAPPTYFPTVLSDTGARHPGTVFFRYGLCLIAFVLIVLSLCLQAYFQHAIAVWKLPHLSSRIEFIITLGFIAAVGVSGLAIVSVRENGFVHGVLAAAFFVAMFAQAILFHNIQTHVTRAQGLSDRPDTKWWQQYRKFTIFFVLSALLCYMAIFPALRVLVLRCSDKSQCVAVASLGVVSQYVTVIALMFFCVSFLPVLKSMKIKLEVSFDVDPPTDAKTNEFPETIAQEKEEPTAVIAGTTVASEIGNSNEGVHSSEVNASVSDTQATPAPAQLGSQLQLL
jgi:hypothetical protein